MSSTTPPRSSGPLHVSDPSTVRHRIRHSSHSEKSGNRTSIAAGYMMTVGSLTQGFARVCHTASVSPVEDVCFRRS